MSVCMRLLACACMHALMYARVVCVCVCGCVCVCVFVCVWYILYVPVPQIPVTRDVALENGHPTLGHRVARTWPSARQSPPAPAAKTNSRRGKGKGREHRGALTKAVGEHQLLKTADICKLHTHRTLMVSTAGTCPSLGVSSQFHHGYSRRKKKDSVK